MTQLGAFSRTAWALTLALAVGCATSCRSESGPTVDWQLRSFDVPAADREAVSDVLGTLLKDKGRVRIGPDGRLLVLAAPSTQKQIEREVLEPLLKRPRPPVQAAPSFSITYWMLLVRPAAAGAAASKPDLPEIAGVIPEILKVSGPAELVLLDRVRLMSGEPEAQGTGRILEVKQRASLAAGRVISDVSVTAAYEGNSWDRLISTRVNLQPGQLAVVGEIGLRGTPRALPRNIRAPEPGDALYLVVKATVDDALASK